MEVEILVLGICVLLLAVASIGVLMMPVEELLSAEQKARLLFLSLLTEEQKTQLDNMGYIRVKGGMTDREYIMGIGYSQNIRANLASNNGRCGCDECTRVQMRVICYHMMLPGVPTWDHMSAQLLYIKYNEEVFLAEAFIN